MDGQRRAWLGVVIAACERAAAQIDGDDPYNAELIADIRRLQARCQTELDAHDPS